jgi:PIN domain nuclease of toxin-antitoxin system
VEVLLDTHVLIWWLSQSTRLGPRARKLLADDGTKLLWSVASSWELAIKQSKGGIQLPGPVRTYLPQVLGEQQVDLLPIANSHALRVAELPHHHGDPFDRMLVAQAVEERIPILTNDEVIGQYEVEVIW